MKIEMYGIPRSTLEAFAEQHKLTMEVHERNPRDFGSGWKECIRYYTQFKNCEIKDGSFLSGTFGNGSTPAEAIDDYAKEISGKRIVLNAYRKDRTEIDVPLLLSN